MQRSVFGFAVVIAAFASLGLAQQAPADGPYKVLKTAKVGGAGGYDYVNADAAARRLYIARTGPTPRINVFDLDTFEPAGEITSSNAHGAVVDDKSGHGFASTKPILMFDAKTLALIKTIEVQGNPDGMLFDPSRTSAFMSSAIPRRISPSSILRTAWWWERLILAGCRRKRPATAKDICMSMSKTRITSLWWTPRP